MASPSLTCWTQDCRAARLLASCAALPPAYAECRTRYGNSADRWNEYVGYRVEALAAIRLEVGDELLRAYHEQGAAAYEPFGRWCAQPTASDAVAGVLASRTQH
jgi:hypothetical protein